MTQGDPPAMVSYGIEVLLLIKRLKAVHPDVIHPWYADNYGALGAFDKIGLYFNGFKV